MRAASPADLEAILPIVVRIQQLHADAMPTAYPPADAERLREAMRVHLAPPRFGFVALVDDRVVGYAVGELVDRADTPFTLGVREATVHQIAVAADAERTGAGTALAAAVEMEARDRSATRIRLQSWAFNAGAHAFFAAQGYERVGHVFERPLT